MIDAHATLRHNDAGTNLKPVCFIGAAIWSTTAQFVVDAPSTGIVCLEALAAAVGWNMHSHNMYSIVSVEHNVPCC